MSFRFRKSFKIAPGVRLNVGKRGMSVSAGVRGARVTHGTHGTTTTIGIPGTGLSYSERSGSRTSSAYYQDPISGLPMTRAQVNAAIRRQLKEQQIGAANEEIRQEQKEYERFTKIAAFSPALLLEDHWKKIVLEREFSLSLYGFDQPDFDIIKNRHLEELARRFKSGPYPVIVFLSLAVFNGILLNADGKITMWLGVCATLAFLLSCISGFFAIRWYLIERKIAIEQAQSEFNEIRAQHEELAKAHPENEKNRIAAAQRLIIGEKASIESALKDEFEKFTEELSELEHSFKMEIGFEIVSDGAVFLGIDLPEIDDVVRKEVKTVLKSGKVSEREKTRKTQNHEYAEGVLGLAFNLAARTFNVSPAVNTVVVSGYTQRISKRTGNLQDDYIYSIRFSRPVFKRINLSALDPIEAVAEFEHRMDLSKTHEFKTIGPFAEEFVHKVGT